MGVNSDFMFERYRMGELNPGQRRRVESDPDFADRMAVLDESDRKIREDYPAGEMARIIREKAGADSRETREPGQSRIRAFRAFGIPGGGFIPLAAAAALVLALVIALPTWRNMGTAESAGMPMAVENNADAEVMRLAEEAPVRAKGIAVPDSIATPHMVLYRSLPEGVEILEDGDAASEHDLLQVGFTGGGAWWGAIFSVDGNGMVTRHWPMDGGESVHLGNTSEVLLPYAYELDDAPSHETFFLVWSDTVFSLDSAELLLVDFPGTGLLPEVNSLNPSGKTGLSVIKILKAP